MSFPYKQKFSNRSWFMLLAAVPALLPLSAVAFHYWLPWWVMGIFCYTKGMVAWSLLEYGFQRWVAMRIRHQCEVLIGYLSSWPTGAKTMATGGTIISGALAAVTALQGLYVATYALGVFAGACLCIQHLTLARQWNLVLIKTRFAGSDGLCLPGQSGNGFGMSTQFWDRIFGRKPSHSLHKLDMPEGKLTSPDKLCNRFSKMNGHRALLPDKVTQHPALHRDAMPLDNGRTSAQG
jgi:hypothetical protein